MFKDHFSGHAADYASHRPTYPAGLFDYLSRLVGARRLAWDCATGNGQAARVLAGCFEKVIATDASVGQIESASGLPENVALRVATAEASGISGSSADLITVAQALHWFEFESFYAEVRRVLAPAGVLAVWSYELTRVSSDIDVLIDAFYRGEIEPFWPPERAHVESGYRTVPFPFDEVQGVPEFSMTVSWRADQLLDYLRTWSAVRRCMAESGSDPVSGLEPELKRVWGDGSREVRWPLNVRVGRL